MAERAASAAARVDADDQADAVRDPAPVLARVTAEPLDVAAVERWVATRSDGAVVTFRGVVRDHDRGQSVTGLEYQAHPEAEALLAQTCARASAASGLRIAAVHRTGALEVGDLALVAAVASPHRAEAFAALAALIDAIKSEVPIWKRQHLAGGATEWVGL